MQFLWADGLLLLGIPIVVALMFLLIARIQVDPPLSSAARMHMNDDGILSEAVDQDPEHVLAA